MRPSASSPTLPLLETFRKETEKESIKQSLARSHSLTARSSQSTNQAINQSKFVRLVHATPFFAVSGLSQPIRNFSRAYSLANLANHQGLSQSNSQNYGSLSAAHHRPSSSQSINQLNNHSLNQLQVDDDLDYFDSRPLSSSGSNRWSVSNQSINHSINQLPSPSSKRAPSQSPSRKPSINQSRFARDLSSDSLVFMLNSDDDLSVDQPADQSINLEEEMNSQMTWPLFCAVFSAVISSFQNGLNSGILNVPEQSIKQSISLSDTDWSLIVSIFCIGGLLGCLIGNDLSNRMGRKNFLVSNNICFMIGCLLMSLAVNQTMMILGRLIIGVGCGAATVVVPIYLGEIAPANLRGSIGTVNQFAVVIGLLVAVLIGKPFSNQSLDLSSDESSDGWRFLLGTVMFPSLCQIMCSSWLLESPLWLVMSSAAPKSTNQSNHQSIKHSSRLMQAESILCQLRGKDNVDFDLEAMVLHRDQTLEEQEEQSNNQTNNQSIFNPLNFKPLSIGVMLQVMQQVSGINCVFFYSTSFFAHAHVSDPWLGSVCCCVVNVLGVIAAIHLMDRVGRRPLLLTSAIGMVLSIIALTYCLMLSVDTSSSQSDFLGYMSVLFVLVFVVFFECGAGPIPWLIGVEIYPSAIRGKGIGLASSVNWGSNFLVSLAFPHIQDRLGVYSFVPFGCCLVISMIGIIVFVPETRGRSIAVIQSQMTGAVYEDDEEWDESDVNDFEHMAIHMKHFQHRSRNGSFDSNDSMN